LRLQINKKIAIDETERAMREQWLNKRKTVTTETTTNVFCLLKNQKNRFYKCKRLKISYRCTHKLSKDQIGAFTVRGTVNWPSFEV
jgi:hypothetical protein